MSAPMLDVQELRRRLDTGKPGMVGRAECRELLDLAARLKAALEDVLPSAERGRTCAHEFDAKHCETCNAHAALAAAREAKL